MTLSATSGSITNGSGGAPLTSTKNLCANDSGNLLVSNNGAAHCPPCDSSSGNVCLNNTGASTCWRQPLAAFTRFRATPRRWISEFEQQVQEAIEHLCQNRTTIVIAHRLHTIMHADAILVVEGGEIVERGRHDDLLRRSGRYASFFRIQHRDAGPLTLAPISANSRKSLPRLLQPPTPDREPFHERPHPSSFLRRRSLRFPSSAKPNPFRFAASGASGAIISNTSARWATTNCAPPFFFAKHADMLVPDCRARSPQNRRRDRVGNQFP